MKKINLVIHDIHTPTVPQTVPLHLTVVAPPTPNPAPQRAGNRGRKWGFCGAPRRRNPIFAIFHPLPQMGKGVVEWGKATAVE